MKVCVISTPYIESPPLKYGGLELVTFNISKGLAKRGHDVTLIAPEGSKADGFKLFTTGKPTGMNVNWLEAEREQSKQYKELIEAENFDVILDSTWYSRIYAYKKIKPEQKIAHVHHGHLNPEWVEWVKQYTQTPNMIAISNWMKRLYLAQHKLFSKVAYNGINTDIYKYDPNVEVTDRLLFVGRLDTFKNPAIALDIAEKTGYPIDIVGSADWSSHKEYAQSIVDRAKKLGSVYLEATTEQKVKLMQSTKAVLVPSTMGEPFGLVAAESMSCGAPVITIDDGGLIEIIGNIYGLGYVCDNPSDMEDLVRRLNDGFENSDYVRSERACYIRENFSLDKMASGYESLLSKVLSGVEW